MEWLDVVTNYVSWLNDKKPETYPENPPRQRSIPGAGHPVFHIAADWEMHTPKQYILYNIP
jgi:hypothetical protein